MLLKFTSLLPVCGLLAACQPTATAERAAKAPLRLVVRQSDDQCVYVAAPGDTVISFDRYPMAVTERFDQLVLVLKPGVG